MPDQRKTEKALATDYGYALSFLKSVPEVYHLFQRALKGNWTSDKFVAQVKSTKWYKKHGETARTNAALERSDPATFKVRFNSQLALVRDKARSVGATLTDSQLRSFTRHSMDFGWNDSQLGNGLSGYIKIKNVTGDASDNLQTMRQSAYKNGMRYSDKAYQNWARRIAAGNATVHDFESEVRKQAASLAPGYSDQLKAGSDLYDVAQPYMQTMASTLELNPGDIDLFDPTIRKAMSGVDKDGKPATTSLWDFENHLRQDKRWTKTKQAQDSFSSTANKILGDWGLV